MSRYTNSEKLLERALRTIPLGSQTFSKSKTQYPMGVSPFFIQRGKCNYCGIKISWQYPIVEFASGFIFLLPLYFYSPIIPNSLFIIQTILWIAVFLIFLLIWAIDYRLYLIPDELNIGLAIL